jgi:NTP pyrophosphatase (non-canonical NTP hydrolase)
MIDLAKLQREIYRNKVDRRFNVTDVGKEIVLMVEELGELAHAYKNSDKRPAPLISHKDEMVDAVGDLMVYCLGLCEMLQVDAGEVLTTIVEQNKTRTHTGWM